MCFPLIGEVSRTISQEQEESGSAGLISYDKMVAAYISVLKYISRYFLSDDTETICQM